MVSPALFLVFCPLSLSEIIADTAESGSNEKTLPHEKRSEVPDGRGSDISGGKNEGTFLHKPLRNSKQLTKITSLHTSKILALSTGVTPTAKRRFARLFTRYLSHQPSIIRFNLMVN